jgi:hypothetical protein
LSRPAADQRLLAKIPHDSFAEALAQTHNAGVVAPANGRARNVARVETVANGLD